MDYKEAMAKAMNSKKSDSFMLVNVSYCKNLVLPHKDGVALLAALANAEQLHEPYDGQHRISGIDRDAVTTQLLSHDEYLRVKVAALLGVKPGEVQTLEAGT
jgi:hypothetical protein